MVTMIPLVCQQARTTTPDGSTLITVCQNHLEFQTIMIIMRLMMTTMTQLMMTTPMSIAGEMVKCALMTSMVKSTKK